MQSWRLDAPTGTLPTFTLTAKYFSGNGTHIPTLTGNIVARNDGAFPLRFKRTGKRDQVFLATKFGFVGAGFDIDGSPKHAKESAEASLKKLGVDYIDLFYLHRCVICVSVTVHEFMVGMAPVLVQTRRSPLK